MSGKDRGNGRELYNAKMLRIDDHSRAEAGFTYVCYRVNRSKTGIDKRAEKTHKTHKEEKGNPMKKKPAGIVIGILFGVAMGIAMENLALWVGIGVAIGAGFDASNKKK